MRRTLCSPHNRDGLSRSASFFSPPSTSRALVEAWSPRIPISPTVGAGGSAVAAGQAKYFPERVANLTGVTTIGAGAYRGFAVTTPPAAQ
ncbi:MAG: hypothetical protein M3P91_03825 [Actinomycetota bacterium]|nr:hypothetical protein [Actinomycetota bacterium]